MNTATIARPLTTRERVALTLHRELDHRLSPLGVWAMRRTRGSLAGPFGVHALLLTTTGRRSARPRTVVLQYFPDGDAFVVVAANDGGVTDPAWYRNLVAEPRATVEIEGRTWRVEAWELPAGEAAAWWTRILDLSPDYERYARATARRFPIVRLTPLPAAGATAPAGGVLAARTGPGRSSRLVLLLAAATLAAGAVLAWRSRRR